MKAIRPRETRLPMDTVREEIQRDPWVLLVTNRTPNDMTVKPYKMEAFDTEFAKNFFYWNDVKETGSRTYRLLMVPFALNGDE